MFLLLLLDGDGILWEQMDQLQLLLQCILFIVLGAHFFLHNIDDPFMEEGGEWFTF